MAESRYKPVRHDHKQFLGRARGRKGFSEVYDALELEYQVADQLLRARPAPALPRTT